MRIGLKCYNTHHAVKGGFQRQGDFELSVVPIEPLPRPETLSDAAYERLAGNLMDGAYSPGDSVTTRGIAAELGVSATPVREAMLRLVQEGALEMRNARSVVVPKLTHAGLNEIYCFRTLLEPMLAATAMQFPTNGLVAKLEDIMCRMIKAYETKDYRTVFRENRSFHFHIYDRSNMPFVISSVRAAWLRIGPTFRLLYPNASNPSDAVRIHTYAIDAIRTGDANGLSAAIRYDLARGETILKKVIPA